MNILRLLGILGIGALLALLQACAAQLVSSQAQRVVVKARPSQAVDAQEIAETECLKQQRHARLTTKLAPDQYGYDCVR